ncbi:MAG: glycine zipper domain-containing protein [Moraxellaceae bacterium]
MKRILMISALVMSTAFSAAAMAGQQSDAVVGAVVGGGAGALIGHSVNGRDGALIGSAIGAITGVAIATSDRDRQRVETRTVVYHEPQVYERVVVREVPRNVVVHRYYEPRRVVVVERKPGRGHGYGHDKNWKRDYAWNDNDRGNSRGRERDNDRGRWH